MNEALHDPLAWLATQAATAAEGPPGRWQTLEGLARRAAALPPGPLREALVERLRAHAQRRPAVPVSTAVLPEPAPPQGLAAWLPGIEPERGDLRVAALQARAWTRLRVERRLAEPLTPPAATVPSRLGPLHAQVLVPRALQLLRELSPDYLERLLGSVDELAALASLNALTSLPSLTSPTAASAPPASGAAARSEAAAARRLRKRR